MGRNVPLVRRGLGESGENKACTTSSIKGSVMFYFDHRYHTSIIDVM